MLVVLGALALGATGCSESLTGAQKLDRAAQSLEQGDYRDAEVRLKALLQKQGDNADAWLLLGRVSLARYRYADAVEQLGRARANGVDENIVGMPLARALLAQGKYQQARDALDGVTPADDQQRADVAALQGRAYLGLDQVGEAAMAFEAALDAVPGFAPALVGNAEIARSAEDLARARTLLEQAIDAAPDYAPAWLALGQLAYADNDCDRAAPAFEKFLSIENAGAPALGFQARSYLADCELRAGDIAAARAHVETLMQQGPDTAFANYLQALIDIRDSDYGAAARHLQQVLAVSPNNVRSLTLLASIKLTQQDTRSAELYLNQAIARAPSSVPALRLLASVYIQRGNNERAVRMLETAYARNPDSDGIRGLLAQAMAQSMDNDDESGAAVADDGALRLDVAAAMARAGNTAAAVALLDGFSPHNATEEQRATAIRIGIELRNGHPDKAVQAAKTLVSNAPDDVETLTILARTYVAIGKDDDAGQALDRALKIAPDNTGLLLERASIHARQREYENARDRLARLLELAPDDLRAQMAMAQIAAAQGDQTGTLSWLEKAHASHPENSQLAVRLVQAYLAAQHSADALELADTLVADHADNAEFNRIRGIAQLAAGQEDDAIESLQTAAAMAPDQPAYRLDLARAQMQAQQPQAALAQLQDVRGEYPDYMPAVGALARLQASMGNGQQALETIQSIAVDDDNRAAVNALKGQIFVAQDDYRKAADAYARAYDARPAQASALALFETRRQAGMDDPAAPLVDWLKRSPNDTAVTMQLAQWYQATDRNTDAARSYQSLLAVNPDNAVALNNLALIRDQQGRDGALAYAQRARRAAPDNAAIADTLGWLLVKDGQAAQGVALLRTAASAIPNDATVQYHLAAGLEKTGQASDRTQARDILERVLKTHDEFDDRESAQALLERLTQDKTGA